MSADRERDMVFLPTTSPSPDFYGGERPGDNAYANSVVALRASTGEFLWGYQTVRHDLWDYDLAAQPPPVRAHARRRHRTTCGRSSDQDGFRLRPGPRDREIAAPGRGTRRASERCPRRAGGGNPAVPEAPPAHHRRATLAAVGLHTGAHGGVREAAERRPLRRHVHPARARRRVALSRQRRGHQLGIDGLRPAGAGGVPDGQPFADGRQTDTPQGVRRGRTPRHPERASPRSTPNSTAHPTGWRGPS